MAENRYAVLVASSTFPNDSGLQALRCPENDVDGLSELLKAYGDFRETIALKNRRHDEVLLRINQVLRQATREDLVLVYYSGHGKLNPAGRLHLATTNTLLAALEATSIPVSAIKDYIDISASNKVVLILDCCFSGAAGSAFMRSGVDDQLQLVSGGRGLYVLAASTGVQVALEKESEQYGVFTKHLIEGVKSGEADLNSDGLIHMDELYRYVHDHVLNEGFQEPMKWDLSVRGEIVVARSPKTPRDERRKQIRELLVDLAKQGVLPDSILSKALEVIAVEPGQTAQGSDLYNSLLERLLGKELNVGEFVQGWYRVGPERGAPQPAAPPQHIEPRAEPAKPRVKAAGGTWLIRTLAISQAIGIMWVAPYLTFHPTIEVALLPWVLLILSGAVLGVISFHRGLFAGISLGWLLAPVTLVIMLTTRVEFYTGSGLGISYMSIWHIWRTISAITALLLAFKTVFDEGKVAPLAASPAGAKQGKR